MFCNLFLLDSRGDWGAGEYNPGSGASPQGQGEPVEVGRDSSGEQKIKVKKWLSLFDLF